MANKYYVWVASKTWKEGDVLHLTSMALDVPREIAVARAESQRKLIGIVDKLRQKDLSKFTYKNKVEVYKGDKNG